ncbi:hypothetical protein JSO19_10680 [Leucobacter sp. UCMA 4100]|uniref:hypothetical protein n=1 Tax=Leucobacter sp. UCMA 4100 TaxID=2810534 RepID=UPI0022EAFB18|nr:hypothetical protein [Leucobacter sp. UCMA 4100]MDA3147841.1 hypothetical protein [Leucobacter sp. UCMA 4100]
MQETQRIKPRALVVAAVVAAVTFVAGWAFGTSSGFNAAESEPTTPKTVWLEGALSEPGTTVHVTVDDQTGDVVSLRLDQ